MAEMKQRAGFKVIYSASEDEQVVMLSLRPLGAIALVTSPTAPPKLVFSDGRCEKLL